MTYRDLSLDPNWIARKERVIVRDGFKCKICNNYNLVKDCLAGLLFFHGENSHGRLFGFYGYNKEGLLINHKVFIKKHLCVFPLASSNGYVVYIDENSENEAFAKMIAIRERELTDYEELVLKHPAKASENNPDESQNKEWKSYKWNIAPSLLVHHAYYQKNRDPLDYPNHSLKTICRECLGQLVEKQGVPYLNENGAQIRTLTPCKKCYGIGSIPANNGDTEVICDRCTGARYEEFFYNAQAL